MYGQVVRTSEIYAQCRTSEIKNSSEKVTSEVTADFNQLKNENVLNYVLLRVLHLSDVHSSIGDKCTNRDFDITDFPLQTSRDLSESYTPGVGCTKAG